MKTTLLALGALALSTASVGSADLLRSRPHSIDCLNAGGGLSRHFDNDTRGLYYSDRGPIRFLDKETGRMMRVSCATMIESWSAGDDY